MAKRRLNSTQSRTRQEAVDERRRADRLSRSIPIYYRWGEETLQRGETVNFSRSGARVKVPAPIEPQSRILLQFDLEPKLKLTVTAEMVWQQPVAREGYLAGVRFSLPDGVEQRLDRWLKKQFKRAG